MCESLNKILDKLSKDSRKTKENIDRMESKLKELE
jgi:prefoldin subunit 5